GILDVVSLHRRKIIDKPGYKARIKELGFRGEGYPDEILKVTEWLPGPSDIIRYMKRDVADEKVVEKYQYDKDFPKPKFDGPVKDVAEAVGLTEQMMRFEWRSHWIIPSYTQLVEIAHRARKDAPGWTGPVVSIAQVKEALEIDDMAPFWVDAMVAAAEHPINVSDGVRAYTAGVFDEKRLKHVYLDAGYSSANADTMVGIDRNIRNRTIANASGVGTVRQTIKLYQQGLINEDQADQLLEPILPDALVRQNLLAAADINRQAQTKAACLKALRHRFMLGLFGVQGARVAVLALGIDPARVADIVDQWACERDLRLKIPAVRQLCSMFTSGLLATQEYIDALGQLGYSPDWAWKTAGVCYSNEVRKRVKAALAAAKTQYKDFLAEQRRTKADMAKEVAAVQKRIKELKAEQATAEKAAEAFLKSVKEGTPPNLNGTPGG